MSLSIKKNLMANLAGKGWTAIMSLLFVPYYIQLMGIESYGMVGLYTVLLAMFNLFDLGLSSTLNREMARLSVSTSQTNEFGDLLRTTEAIYFAIAFLIAFLMVLLSPFLATKWLSSENLSVDQLKTTFYLMAAAIAFQWPSALYSGGLMGLQKQVLNNQILMVVSTLRGFGTLFLLWAVAPTIEVFFASQVFVSLVQTLLTRIALWKSLPKSDIKAEFSRAVLKRIWRFAIGVSANSIVVVILTQMDKIILSKMLNLEMFGYYSLASVVASSLTYLMLPIFSTYFPKFSQLVQMNALDELKATYHSSCQMMGLFIFPLAIMGILFASEFLSLWTGDALTVERASLLVSVLMVGVVLNGMMQLPYALQLAYGWTKLAFYQNLIAVFILLPLLVLGIHYYGAIGAVFAWVLLNLSYVLVMIQIMHRKILVEEKLNWYWKDFCKPLMGALIVPVAGYFFFPINSEFVSQIATLLILFLGSLLGCAFFTPVSYPFLRKIFILKKIEVYR